jgi:hypothetical protein
MSDSHVIPFVINTRPLCVWDTEIKAINLQFMKNFDPSYFKYVAESNIPLLEGQEAKHAALALRTTYSHALETFFALLGAALQAPDCVVGWMTQYRNNELDSLIDKIQTGTDFRVRFVFERNWRGLARLIFRGLQPLENFDAIANRFGDAWQDFAHDFLDSKKRSEYNSLKHGFRITHGGFKLWIGKPGEHPIPDKASYEEVSAAKENMLELNGSPFGSAYFVTERFIEGNKANLRLEQHAFNWE